MNYLKEITKDLIDYLIEGKIDNTAVDWFDSTTGTFPSTYLSGKKFKFLRKIEQVDPINDDSIIPVLLITIPDKYKEGFVMKNNTFIDLKQVIVSPATVNKLHFFVIPYIGTLTGSFLGTLRYIIDVDYETDYDVYGYIADEISELLKLMYWKALYPHQLTTSTNRKLFFVPNNIQQLSNGTILSRIKHFIDIRGCGSM